MLQNVTECYKKNENFSSTCQALLPHPMSDIRAAGYAMIASNSDYISTFSFLVAYDHAGQLRRQDHLDGRQPRHPAGVELRLGGPDLPRPTVQLEPHVRGPVGSKAAGAAFKGTWTLSYLDVAWMGLIADEHPAICRTIEAAGHTHGNRIKRDRPQEYLVA